MKHNRSILAALILLMVGIGVYGVNATIPQDFWRIVQKGFGVGRSGDEILAHINQHVGQWDFDGSGGGFNLGNDGPPLLAYTFGDTTTFGSDVVAAIQAQVDNGSLDVNGDGRFDGTDYQAIMVHSGGGVTGADFDRFTPGDEMAFQYGDFDNPVDKVLFAKDGSMSVSTEESGASAPVGSALLYLESSDKAVLVPRLTSRSSLLTPVDGMIAYLNDEDCFKVHQGGEWSECFNVATGFQTGVDLAHDAGVLGSVYFDTDSKTIFIHDGQTWDEVGQSLVNVGPDADKADDAEDGEIYYATDIKTLFIRYADQWFPIEINLDGLASVTGACQQITYDRDRGQELACPNNMFAKRVILQGDAWASGNDNLQTPEIQALECCELSYETTGPAPEPLTPPASQPQTGSNPGGSSGGSETITNGPRTTGQQLHNYISGILRPDDADSPVDFDGNGIVVFGNDFTLVRGVLVGDSDARLETYRQGTDPASTKSGADIRADVQAALATPGPNGLSTALLDIDGAGDGYTARDEAIMNAYESGIRNGDLQSAYDGTAPTAFTPSTTSTHPNPDPQTPDASAAAYVVNGATYDIPGWVPYSDDPTNTQPRTCSDFCTDIGFQGGDVNGFACASGYYHVAGLIDAGIEFPHGCGGANCNEAQGEGGVVIERTSRGDAECYSEEVSPAGIELEPFFTVACYCQQ